MKFLIISLAVVACAYAADDATAGTLRSDFQNNPDGGFHYNFETENGISQQVDAQLKQLGKDEVALQVQGSNQHISPDGQKIQLSYVADENGYRPQGEHLPTPPAPQPIPDYILRSLAFIAAHPHQEKY